MSTIKFEKGKFYKTRSGKKVECVYTSLVGDNPLLFVVEGADGHFTARQNGRYYDSDGSESGYDIISEWPNEQVMWVVYSGFSGGVAAFESYSLASECLSRIPQYPANSLTRVVIQDGHIDKE